ncbi:MAG: hypothetical protein R2939_20185 [Kofleriaceae bacterium]
MRAPSVSWPLVACLVATACSAGGTYARRDLVDDDGRGDTNGRSFDFVSTKPQGDEWTVRLRGRSMWVAYSTAEQVDDLGTFRLSEREAEDVWRAIDDLDLAGRKRGIGDRYDGTITLRQRDPGDVEHDLYLVYVSRLTEDEAVLELGEILLDVIEDHTGERPKL